MNSLLASSLYGNDFIKYRLNNNVTQRNRFSNNIINRYVNEVPIIVDSIDSELQIADKIGFKEKSGKEYHFNKNIIIEDILLEVSKKLKLSDGKVLKIGLDNGKVLNNTDVIGELYIKYKNQDDNILYLLLTQETTIYGYIMSLIKYVFNY